MFTRVPAVIIILQIDVICSSLLRYAHHALLTSYHNSLQLQNRLRVYFCCALHKHFFLAYALLLPLHKHPLPGKLSCYFVHNNYREPYYIVM